MEEYPANYLEILQAYKQHMYDTCLNLIDQVPEVCNQYAEYQVLKCSCMINLGLNTEEVHESLDIVLAKYPKNAFAIYAKGLAYFAEQRYEESIERFGTAMELDTSATMSKALEKKIEAERLLKIMNEKHDPDYTGNSLSYGEDDGQKRVQCEICSKFFQKKFNLDRHKLIIHRIRKSEIVPLENLKSIKTKTPKKMPLNDSSKNELDDDAKKKDSKNNSLEDGEIECPICGKLFTKIFSLTRHMKIHSNNRPHKCKICELGFIQNSDKIRHEATHTSEMNFMCKKCKLKFKTQRSLHTHDLKYHLR